MLARMRRRILLSLVSLAFAQTAAHGMLGCSSSDPAPTEPVRPLGTEVPISDHVKVANLEGPVDVVRDSYGTIHIYATTMLDALRVQAYQCAKDRTIQLELIRRFAEGRIAEVYGGINVDAIDSDIGQRTIGLTRTAKKIYEGLPAESAEKKWLDAYADGINQFYARVQAGDETLPKAMVGFGAEYLTPWTGVDSLAIARYQSQNLSFDADSDVDRQSFLDNAKKTFDPASPDAKLKARSNFFRDYLRFAPLDPTTTITGFPDDLSHTQGLTVDHGAKKHVSGKLPSVAVPRALLDDTAGWRKSQAFGEQIFGDLPTRGSNNWIVGASKSTTGHPIVANDPHLSLSAPAVFWMVHVNVTAKDAKDDADFAGLSFPGIPAIILGFNDHVAWASTTAGWDVTDVYKEQLSQDGTSVTFNGAQVTVQKIRETILINGSPPLEYDVLDIPHHGPIIPTIVDHKIIPPDPSKGALSYRWTGKEPSAEITTVKNLVLAKNVEDVRTAVRSFGVGAQNWVAADDQGNIFYSAQARIPIRDKRAYTWDEATYTGTLPMFVLPGDGTAEWTGDLDEGYIPHGKNPASGFYATANGDPLGVTLDNDPSNDKLPNGDPVYVGGDFDTGYRVGRITERLKAKEKLSPDDLASIQGDGKSPLGSRLTPILLEALTRADEEKATPGTHPDLTAIVADARYAGSNLSELEGWLNAWKDTDYDTASGMNPDDNTPSTDAKEAASSQATLLFNTWLVRMGMLTFDDEFAILPGAKPYSVPAALTFLLTAPKNKIGTLDIATNESIVFDDLSTPQTETRDERAVRSLLDAVDYLTTKLSGDRNKWRWGSVHALRFTSLVSLWSSLSIPAGGDPVFPIGFPRHGDLFGVDAANYGSHPGKLADVSFTYGSGPVQRFVADVAAPAPVVKNVLPGGEVWDTASPHFKDDAELWRRNKSRPVWIVRSDVVKDAKERIAYDK
ncbi:penicillin acylase family protein [soil metagenome]